MKGTRGDGNVKVEGKWFGNLKMIAIFSNGLPSFSLISEKIMTFITSLSKLLLNSDIRAK